MHDIGDERPASLPSLAIADKKTVAEQSLKCTPHLRALPLEILVTRDDDVADVLRAVHQHDLTTKNPDGVNSAAVCVSCPGFDQVALCADYDLN